MSMQQIASAMPQGPVTEARPGGYLGLTLLIGVVQMVVTMDLVVIGMLLPSIGLDFHANASALGAVVSTGPLVFAGLLLVGGRLADMFGQKRCLCAGLVIAGIGTACSALAPSLAMLVAGRVLYGLGAACMIPANFSLINTVIPDGAPRQRAYGVYGTVQGFALFLAPVVGGLLISEFGWRSVFQAVTLLIIILLLLAMRMLPSGEVRKGERIDLPSAFLLVPALFAILAALSGGFGLDRASELRWGVGIAGIVAMLLFLHRQRRAAEPLLPLDTFASPVAIAGLFAAAAVMAASAGLFILPSMVMQQAMGWSAAAAGAGMLPHAITVIITGQCVGLIMGRIPLFTNVCLGLALLTVGTFANSWMQPDLGYVLNVMLPMILAAAGAIFSTIMLIAYVTGQLPPERQGVGTAIIFTSQQIGVAVGSAFLLDIAGHPAPRFEALNHAFLATSAIAAAALVAIIITRRLDEQSTSDKE